MTTTTRADEVRGATNGEEAVGLAAGAFGALLAAAALVPLRDHVSAANVALILLIPVLAAALIGGRVAAIGSSVVAAMTFDFWFTRPYFSLKMNDSDDIVTMVLLVAVSLIVAEAGIRLREYRKTAEARRVALQRLYRVADLASHGAVAEDVEITVCAELMGLLELEHCEFKAGPSVHALPELTRRGTLTESTLRSTRRGLVAETGPFEIPVESGGRAFGRLVLHPGAQTRSTLDVRLVAVALADELALSLAATRS